MLSLGGDCPIDKSTIKNKYQKSICQLTPNEKIKRIMNFFPIKNVGAKNNTGAEQAKLRKIAKKIVLIVEVYPRSNMFQRIEYITHIGFALFDRKCLRSIAEFLGDSNVIEIGADTGLLSLVLKYYADVNISPTEKPEKQVDDWIKKFDATKDNLDELYPDCNTILMSWPHSYLKSVMDNLPPRVTKIVIIGEGVDGATDCLYSYDEDLDKEPFKDVRVYEYAEEKDNNISNNNNNIINKKEYPFREVKHNIELPRFIGIMDRVTLYERY